MAAIQQQLNRMEAQARDLFATGDMDRAVAQLRRMAHLDAEHPKVYLLATEWHLSGNRWDEARRLMDSLGSRGPGREFGEGVLALYQKDYARADSTLLTAQQGYESIGHIAGQASSLLAIATSLRFQQQLDQAEAQIEAARSLFARIDDHGGEAACLSHLGKVQLDRGDSAKALELQRAALALREAEGDAWSQTISWQEIGRTLRLAGRPREALTAIEHALELRRASGDRPGEYAALLDLAKDHSSLDEPEQALALGRDAIELARQLPADERLPRAELLVGRWEVQLGRDSEALPRLRGALGRFQALNLPRDEALTRVTLGSALLKSGKLTEADDVLDPALALVDGIGDAELQAKTFIALGTVRANRRELDSALWLRQRAVEVLQAGKLRPLKLTALNDLADAQFRIGDAQRAESLFRQVLDLAVELKDVRQQARARFNLAIVLAERGHVEQALDHARQASALWKEADHPDVAWAQLLVAALAWRQERTDRSLGALAAARGRFESTPDVEGLALALTVEAEARRESGQAETARALYDRAIALARVHGLAHQEWQARAGLAATLEAGGRLAAAAAECERAIDLIEALRLRVDTTELRTRFLSGKTDPYERALTLYARQDLPEAAFLVAERSRARSLIDLLAESRAALRRTVDPALVAREQSLTDEISSAALALAQAPDEPARETARSDLARAEERLRALAVEMRRNAPAYSGVVYPRPAGLAEVQSSVLAPGEVLLTYHVGRERAILWIIDRASVRMRELAPSKRIERLVSTLMAAAGPTNPSLGARPSGVLEAEALAAALLPVELPAGTRLLISADGPLHRVPFGALRRNGRYLVEDHEVVMIPSATTIEMLRTDPRPPAASGFLAVGAPIDSAAEALPDARQSLERIATTVSTEPSVVLAAERATKAELQALPLERFRQVYIATHGWHDPDDPRHFGLRLTADGRGGGMLQLDEIFSMRLAAELVVLAACDSGRGEVVPGEGLISAAWAFLHAGARSVIVSLWPMSERSTEEFMEAFYTELAQGRSAPDALRRVQLAFMRSDRPAWRQIFRWAPFVIVGDPTRADGPAAPAMARLQTTVGGSAR